MTELSRYVFSELREGELTLYRGSGDGLAPILLVAPIGEYSARESLKRLERWADYTGLSATGLGWQAAVHPDDLARHLAS